MLIGAPLQHVLSELITRTATNGARGGLGKHIPVLISETYRYTLIEQSIKVYYLNTENSTVLEQCPSNESSLSSYALSGT